MHGSDASVVVKNHQDKIGPVSTIAFVTLVWMIITTVAEELAERGVQLFIHPSHNVPGDTTAHERLNAALRGAPRQRANLRTNGPATRPEPTQRYSAQARPVRRPTRPVLPGKQHEPNDPLGKPGWVQG